MPSPSRPSSADTSLTTSSPDASSSPFSFTLKKTNGKARRGEIRTSRGTIQTPAFMPVGTVATVKAMYPDQVRATGAQIILGNTYHLMLRPGAEAIASFGGLHTFMNWPGPILTDSGGFQVMSLSKLRKITEQGVTFQSHIDGSRHEVSPERSIEIQCLLGSDIQMAFDECTPYPCSYEEARKSMELSMRWAARSKAGFEKYGGKHQALFGIMQGSTFEDLRKQSASALREIGFDGYAIGGLAVGEGHDKMVETLKYAADFLPEDRPRYLMGVGTPLDLLAAVEQGIDMFDCVMPTRSGRHGQAFTWGGKINLNNAKFRDDLRPLDPQTPCPASQDYSRAYLHHLFKAREYLGAMLLSWANIAFYQDFMHKMRRAIEEDRFEDFAHQVRTVWEK